jgi:hypothetical protein
VERTDFKDKKKSAKIYVIGFVRVPKKKRLNQALK